MYTDDGSIKIDVVCALPGRLLQYSVELCLGSSAMAAIDASGIRKALPPDAIDAARLGVHGRLVDPEQVLVDGDRVEIYRPLSLDPMQARRRRAAAG